MSEGSQVRGAPAGAAFVVIGAIGLLALASAARADMVYWSQDQTGQIGQATVGGAAAERCPTGTVGIGGVALDPAAGDLYWIEAGDIHRGRLTGPCAGAIWLSPASAASDGLAIDTAARRIYWIDDTGPDKLLMSSPLDAPAESVAAQLPDDAYFGLAVYGTYAYASGFSTLYRRALGAAGADATLDGLDAWGVAHDAASGRTYWVNGGSPFEARSTTSWTGAGDPVAPLSADASGIAYDATRDALYWTDAADEQIRIGPDSAGVVAATGASARPQYLAVLTPPVAAGAPVIGLDSTTGLLTCSGARWAADAFSAFAFHAPSGYAYTWTRDGAPIPGVGAAGEGPAPTPGTYTCAVTASNAAGASAQESEPLLLAVGARAAPAGPSAAGVAIRAGRTVRRVGRRSVTLITPVTVTRAGFVLQTARGPRGRLLCSAQVRMRGPGTVRVTCVMGARTRRALARSAVRYRLVTNLTAGGTLTGLASSGSIPRTPLRG